jgi:uncharacterized membrane protein
MEYRLAARTQTIRSISPGIVLGLGLGGFIDGIALHQIAQWHNMGSAKVPPITMEAMQQNMGWDGWFHVATLLSHARAGRRLPDFRSFTGQLLLGWGAFNLVEGIIDHHILEIHHVRDLPRHVPIYDWLFLGIGGVGLLLIGWWMARSQFEVHRP